VRRVLLPLTLSAVFLAGAASSVAASPLIDTPATEAAATPTAQAPAAESPAAEAPAAETQTGIDEVFGSSAGIQGILQIPQDVIQAFVPSSL